MERQRTIASGVGCNVPGMGNSLKMQSEKASEWQTKVDWAVPEMECHITSRVVAVADVVQIHSRINRE